MNTARQINAVAMAMGPFMKSLDEAVTKLTGTHQHNIVLVIGCADVSHYASNVKRPESIKILKDLFARWQLGMDDVMPGEVSTGDTKAFEYLLNTFEEASQAPEPARLDYANRRAELFAYVGRLEAKARRQS